MGENHSRGQDTSTTTLVSRISRLQPGVLTGSAFLIVPLGLVVLLIVVFASESIQAAATNSLIMLLAAVALAMFWGNSGTMSLGHAGFMAVGAYTGGILTLDPVIKATAIPALPDLLRDNSVGLVLGVIAVLLVAVLVAVPAGSPLLRVTGHSFVIVSYAVLVIINVVLNAGSSWTRGSQTFYGLTGGVSIWLVFGGAAIAIIYARYIRESSLGMQLRASREDELAARACGIHVERSRLGLWILSSLPAALAGFMLALFLSAFTPATFYLDVTITIVAMVLVGGLQSTTGTVVGVIAITVLLRVLQSLQGGFSIGSLEIGSIGGLPQVGLGILILVTLYLRPKGFMGGWEFDELVLRKARRDHEHREADRVARTVKHVQKSKTNAKDHSDTQSTILMASGITKEFGRVKALSDAHIQIKQGEIIGLIGPNGSGKTTLLNVLSGVLKPEAGQVMLNGNDITAKSPHAIVRAGVGRTFQNIRLFDNLSVLENIRVGAMRGGQNSRENEDRALELLNAMGLVEQSSEIASSLPYGLQRRLEIARALAVRPDFILLDEPAAGMNDVETEALRERLVSVRDQYQVGILVVDHAVGMMVRLCDRITVLNEGHVIADGLPSEVQRDQNVIEAYFGSRGAAEAEKYTTKNEN